MYANFRCGRAWPGRVAGCLLAALMHAPAFAQQLGGFPDFTEAVYDTIQYPGESQAQPQAFGIVDTSILTLSGWSFRTYDAALVTFLTADGARIYCTTTCQVVATVNLPSGVRVTSIELDVVDSDSNGHVLGQIYPCPKLSLSCNTPVGVVATGQAATPGAVLVSSATDLTIQNDQRTYLAWVNIAGGTIDTRFHSMRIHYQRQISPAPGVATFSDVPKGHTFFAGIEALAASGITGGCGGGKYCPDDPVTRGQMATFLARALGLHWPD